MNEKKDIQPGTAFFPVFEKYDMSIVKIDDQGLQRSYCGSGGLGGLHRRLITLGDGAWRRF